MKVYGKRITAALVAVLMLLTSMPAAFAEGAFSLMKSAQVRSAVIKMASISVSGAKQTAEGLIKTQQSITISVESLVGEKISLVSPRVQISQSGVSAEGLYQLPENATEPVNLARCTSAAYFELAEKSGENDEYELKVYNANGQTLDVDKLVIVTNAQDAVQVTLSLREVQKTVTSEVQKTVTSTEEPKQTSTYKDDGSPRMVTVYGNEGQIFNLASLAGQAEYVLLDSNWETPVSVNQVQLVKNEDGQYSLQPLVTGADTSASQLCVVVDTQYVFHFSAQKVTQEHGEDDNNVWLWKGSAYRHGNERNDYGGWKPVALEQSVLERVANTVETIQLSVTGRLNESFTVKSLKENGLPVDFSLMYASNQGFTEGDYGDSPDSNKWTEVGRRDKTQRGTYWICETLQLNSSKDNIMYLQIVERENGVVLQAVKGNGESFVIGNQKLYTPKMPIVQPTQSIVHANVRVSGSIVKTGNDGKNYSGTLDITGASATVTYNGKNLWKDRTLTPIETTGNDGKKYSEFGDGKKDKFSPIKREDALDPDKVTVSIKIILADGAKLESGDGTVIQLEKEYGYTLTKAQMAAAIAACPNQWGYDIIVDLAELINDAEKTTSVLFTKVWKDNGNALAKRPSSIVLTLGRKTGNGELAGFAENTVKLTSADASTSNANVWTKTVDNLAFEDEAGNRYTYGIIAESFNNEENFYTSAIDGTTVTNTAASGETTELTVTKTWLDGDGERRPEKLRIYLYQQVTDGIATLYQYYDMRESDLLTGSSNIWQYTFKGLPIANQAGVEYTYQADENRVSGYKKDKKGNAFTNTLLMDIPVKKIWDDEDNKYATHPESITVELLAGEKSTGKTIALGEENSWKGTFKDVPKYDDQNNEIEYRVQETNVPVGYKATTSQNKEGTGFTITNELQLGDMVIRKNVIDATTDAEASGKQAFAFTVKEKETGKEIDNFTLTDSDTNEGMSEGGSSHKIEGLVIGRPYVITETNVNGEVWDTNVTGGAPAADGMSTTITVSANAADNVVTFTNTRKVRAYTFTKRWVDGDGKGIGENYRRPTPQFALEVNGKIDENALQPTLIEGEGNVWKYAYANLPQADEAGKTITYKVYEKDESGAVITSSNSKRTIGNYRYNVQYSANNTAITNWLHMTVSGTKCWNDGNDQNRPKPEEVWLKLVAITGAAGADITPTSPWTRKNVGPIWTKTEGDTWEFEFRDVQAYDYHGVARQYKVEEYGATAEKYTLTYADNKEGMNAINSLTTGNITVKKVVTDGNNENWDNEEFTFIVNGDEENRFTLKDGESYVLALPLGNSFTITEVSDDEDPLWLTSWAVNGGDAAQGNTATGTVADGTTVTFTNVRENPHLEVEKSASRPANDSAFTLGEVVHYEVKVTNNGDVTLTDIVFTDSLTGIDMVTTPAGTKDNGDGSYTIASLAPGATATFHYTYSVTEDDVLAGKVDNVASAETVYKRRLVPDSGEATVTVGQAVTVTLRKTIVDNTSDSGNGREAAFDFEIVSKADERDSQSARLGGDASGTDNADGSVTFEKPITLTAGQEYTITETVNGNVWTTTSQVNGGEDQTGNEATLTVSGLGTDVVSFTNTRKLGDNEGTIAVRKAWADGSGSVLADDLIPKQQLSAQLYCSNGADGDTPVASVAPVAITDKDGQPLTHDAVFTNLPAAGLDGTTYTYTVKEVGEKDGTITIGEKDGTITIDGKVYGVTVGTMAGGFVITNTLKPIDPVTPTKSADEAATMDGVEIGDTITYTIGFTNHNAVAAQVVVTDTLTEGLEYGSTTRVEVNGDVVNVTPQVAAQTLTWTISEVPPLASGTITFTATVTEAAVVEDKLSNTAEVKIGGADAVETKAVEVTVKAPNLFISKVADKDFVKPGDEITYTVTVENKGAGKATGVEVTDAIPAGTELVDPAPAGYNSATGVWTIGDIAAGDSAKLTVIVKVDADADADTKATSVTNTATITEANGSETKDPQPQATVVTPVARIKVDKTAQVSEGHTAAEAGDVINYTITVTNNGGAKLTGVTVTDAMFAKADAGSILLNGGAATLSNGAVTVGTLEASGSATITYSYTVTEADILAGTAIENVATATAEEGATDEDEAQVPVSQAVAVTLSKTIVDESSDSENGLEATFKFTIAPAPEEGAETVTLGNGESASLKLKAGASYTITETVNGNVWSTTSEVNGAAAQTGNEATLTVGGLGTDVVTFTNTRKLGDNGGRIAVSKAWADGDEHPLADDLIPKQQLFAQLYRSNEESYGEPVAFTGTDGKPLEGVSFEKLPAADLDGTVYTYTVKEVGEDDGTITIDGKVYGVAVTDSENGFVITNTRQNDEGRLDKTVASDSAAGANGAAVQVGDVITYKIAYYNHMNTAQNITVTDTLSAGLAYVAEGSTTDGIAAGQSITWTMENVSPFTGGTITVKASVTEAAFEVEGVTNEARAQVGNDFTVDSQSVTNDVLKPNLSITKTADKEFVKPGDEISYTVTVENKGAGKATGVVVTDAIPAGTELVDPAPAGYNSATGVWTIGDIAAKDYAELKVAVKVDADTKATSVTNTATVTEAKGQDVADIPEATVETPVARISVVKTAQVSEGHTAAEAGDVINYRITVTNNGGAKLTGVTVTDAMFAKADAGSILLNGGAATLNGNVVTVGELVVRGDATITYSYTVTEADILAGTAIENVATATANGDITDKDEAEVEVSQAVTVTLTKTIKDDTLDSAAGMAERFTFTIAPAMEDGGTQVTLGNGSGASLKLKAGETYTITEMVDGNVWTTQSTATGVEELNNSGASIEITTGGTSEGQVTFTNTRIGTGASAMKVWAGIGADGVPEAEQVSIALEQYIGEQPKGKVSATPTIDVSDPLQWSYEWTNLPAYTVGGVEYTYRPIEEGVTEGNYVVIGNDTYQVAYRENDDHVAIITNNFVPPAPATMTVSGTKTWVDEGNAYGVRPGSITVTATGQASGQSYSATVSGEGDSWNWSIPNLPIDTYTVSEAAVNGYQSQVSGTDITNTLEGGEITVSGIKAWNDANAAVRPASVTIALYADGTDTGLRTTATENSGWAWSFTGLARYAGGREIAYTVQEADVPDGYETAVNGTTITNTAREYNLTIRYWYNAVGGDTAAATYTRVYRYGEEYNVASPAISGWTPDIGRVRGTMPNHDAEFDVVYTRNNYTLTIYYVYSTGGTAAPTYRQTGMYAGDNYDETSPVIDGYTVSRARLNGTMPARDQEFTVIYTPDGADVVEIIEEYGVPLGIGSVVMNLGDCFE